MTAPMRLPVAAILFAGLLAGCGGRATPIPAGAQQVHVAVTESGIRLDPASARAGDVYVVLDTPGSSVGFIQGQRGEADAPGPLDDEDVARIAATGDSQGTSQSSFDQFGCSPEQRAEDLGQLGPCGNVSQVALTAGKYVFFTGDLTSGPPRAMAILEILP